MSKKIYLTHSAVQHSYHLAFALQKVKSLKKYITSYYFKKNRWYYKIVKFNPRIYSFLLKRNFTSLNENLISTLPLLEFVEQFSRFLFGNSQRTLNVSYWKDRTFSKVVAKIHISYPNSIVIGYPNCSLEIFRKTKELNGLTVLDLPTLHHRSILSIIEEERKISPEFSKSLSTIDSKYFQRLDKEIDLADFIVVPSRFVELDLIKTGVDKDKIIRIPYGSNVAPSSLHEISEYTFGNPLKIVFVGQIQQKKGIKYLLEAVKNLKEQGLNISLSLVGKIYDCEEQLDKFSNVYTHVPFMDRDSLRKFLLTQHVFCLPSLIEGSSLACVEAAACGLVCVVSQNTGAEVVTPENGFVCQIRDSMAIETIFKKLYNDPSLCNEMKKASLKNARELSWENYYKSWANFILPLAR